MFGARKEAYRLCEDTTTQCLLFSDIFPKLAVVEFDQRRSSSDGGAILLKAADRRLGLFDALAACLVDPEWTGPPSNKPEFASWTSVSELGKVGSPLRSATRRGEL